jgi:hypothetical protein
MENKELKINIPGKSTTQRTIVNRPPNNNNVASTISNSIVNTPPRIPNGNQPGSNSQSTQALLENVFPQIIGNENAWNLSGDKLTLDIEFDKNAKFDVDANGKLTITFSPQYMQLLLNEVANNNIQAAISQAPNHGYFSRTQAHLAVKALGLGNGGCFIVNP